MCLLLLLKMSQNTIDNVLVLNTRDDFHGPTAPTTDSISILKTRLSACAQVIAAWRSAVTVLPHCDSAYVFATFGRRDLPTPPVVGGQHAVIAGKIDAGLRHQGSQTCDEIHRLECHLRGAIPVGRLQGVDHLAGGAE